MSEMYNIWKKFPNLRPILHPPAPGAVCGFGTALRGGRDHDPETGTYVTTLAATALFVPVLSLGAYRVADTPTGGKVFFGKVPLSWLARGGNVLMLLLLVLAGGGWWWWTAVAGSPAYLAGRKLDEADKLLAAGQPRRAAEMYREVLLGNTEHATTARTKLTQLVQSPPEAPEDAAAVFRIALDLQRQNRSLVSDLYQRGAALAAKHAGADPRGALALLEAVAPAAPKQEEHRTALRRLLERLVVADPNNVEVASRLAVVCQEQGDLARCEAILAPHEARLGQLDGAAILGHIRADQGKFDQAYALLNPFLEARLGRLRAAEKGYENAVQRVVDRLRGQLENGTAEGFPFDRYNRAGKAEQSVMLQDYVAKAVAADPAVQAAQQARETEVAVAPAAIDLGTVLLRRAQGRADPAARKADLEKAEKTFLSVHGTAGESDQFRLNLGQVYYWLGKPGEGRKLFDELLQAHGRSTDLLLGVGAVLREVGAVSEARPLIEEAYNKERDPAKKQAAAHFRSLLFTDLDDEILWLGRAGTDAPEVRANLATARGHKAEREGKEEEAAAQYRQALETYAKMAESAATLNNSAIVHFALYQLRYDSEQFTRGIDKLDRAIALKPGDSILLDNAAGVVLESTLRDVIGPALDFKVLKRGAHLDLLSFLYQDREGKQKVIERVRKHPGVHKARGYYEKVLVLAPKRADSYTQLAALDEYVRAVDDLRGLWQRLQGVELDLADQTRETLDYYAGKDDAKKLADTKVALERQQGIVQTARKSRDRTFATGAALLVRQQIGASGLLPPDGDAVVRLAEEAHAAAPSSGTQNTLIFALFYRAHQSLAKSEPAYADLAVRTQRSLGSNLLTWIIGREGPLRARALAHPDVQRALALKVEQAAAFPDDMGPGTWALLRFAHPREAARIAEEVRGARIAEAGRVDELKRSIDRVLSPLSVTAALDSYWALLLAGKEKEADEVFQGLAARGVPLPGKGK
jgi:tetratricopeptide (TPR) repeat protein